MHCLFFDQINTDILLSFVLFYVQNTFTVPQPLHNVLKLNTNMQIMFDLFFVHNWAFLEFELAFSRVRFMLFILFVAPIRQATSMFNVNFKEECMSLVTNTNKSIYPVIIWYIEYHDSFLFQVSILVVLISIYGDITFDKIWLIVDTTQNLNMRYDLILAGLDYTWFLERKEYIIFLNFKLFETVAKWCLWI